MTSAGVKTACLLPTCQIVSIKASILAQRFERLATRNRLKESIEAREKLIAVDKELVEMRELLNQTRVASRAQVIETLQQYHLQTTIQAGEQGQLAESEAAILTLDRKLEEITAQFVADQSQKLAEALRKADHLKEELVKASTKHERTRIAAPLTGTVQQLAVNTVGQVVSPGQALMTIVPFDTAIEIEALIQNLDIGFVEPGQTAVVKIEPFPFTRYGTVDGTVTRVSRDAVDEREASALASSPLSSYEPQQGVVLLARPQDHHRLAGQMRERQLGFDPFDAAIVHVRTALGDGSPGLALLPHKPDSQRASMIGKPLPASLARGSSLLGTSAKMPASWASFSSLISRRRRFRSPAGRCKPSSPWTSRVNSAANRRCAARRPGSA